MQRQARQINLSCYLFFIYMFLTTFPVPNKFQEMQVTNGKEIEYCATMNALQCCREERIDSCGVEFHDTTCYCDIFCYRDNSDCCPDYTSLCAAPNNIQKFTGVY